MYLMYGNYGAMATQASVGLVLAFIAFVAAIVVTVIFYRKFISVDNTYKTPSVKGDWGPFFRFEHLIIENILKVLYIFTASLIAFECAGSIITSLFGIMYDAGAAFAGIIFFLILFVVLEVINRLWFEFSLLTVLIWKNTSAIRKSVADDTTAAGAGFNPFNPIAPSDGIASQTTNHVSAAPQNPAYAESSYAQPTAPTSPVQPVQHPVPSPSVPQATEPAPQPVDPQVVATPQAPAQAPTQAPVVPSDVPAQPSASSTHSHNSAWTCPSCGAFNKSGSFCAQCGTRRN